jgi:hypothetical protein
MIAIHRGRPNAEKFLIERGVSLVQAFQVTGILVDVDFLLPLGSHLPQEFF